MINSLSLSLYDHLMTEITLGDPDPFQIHTQKF